MTKKKYTDELLTTLVKESLCYSEVVRKLGACTTSGGVYNNIRKRIAAINLDVSHFLGRGSDINNRQRGLTKKKHHSEVLIKKESLRRVHSYILRRALIEAGVCYECLICKITKWQDKKITLHVEHKDGDAINNEIKNLCFLCPNCHSQTATHSQRKIRSVG